MSFLPYALGIFEGVFYSEYLHTVVWEQVRSFGRTPYERKRQQRCLNHFSVIKITPGARDVGFLSGGMFYEQILSLSLDSLVSYDLLVDTSNQS